MNLCQASNITTPLFPTGGPRERALEDGIASLGDSDLLAVVLGTGLAGRPVSVVASELLDWGAGLEGLARLGPSAIAERPGIGLVKALRLSAAMEIGRRAVQRAMRPRPPLRNADTVVSYIQATLMGLEHEELWVISLDGRNNLRGCRRVAQGGIHGCTVAPRDVFRAGIIDAASTMVLAHNHPSGDPSPSAHDVAMTKALISASDTVGIPIVDHVIVSIDGRFSSMLGLGLIQP